MIIPLLVLAFLSLFAGYIELPENFGHVHLFSGFLNTLLPEVHMGGAESSEFMFQLLSAIVSLGGVYLAYVLYYKQSKWAVQFSNSTLNRFFYIGLGFDWLYEHLFVKPVTWLSEIDRKDIIDKFYTAIGDLTIAFNVLLIRTHSGKLRWYVMGLTLGIVLILTIMLSL